MEKSGVGQLPVMEEDDELVGVVSMKSLTSKMIRGGCSLEDKVSKALSPEYPTIPHDLNLGRVSRILEKDLFAVIQNPQANGNGTNGVNGNGTNGVASNIHIITRSDFLHYLSEGKAT